MATIHAAPAATPTWSTDRHDRRSRSSRVRMETRERSAASSISGAARSLKGAGFAVTQTRHQTAVIVSEPLISNLQVEA